MNLTKRVCAGLVFILSASAATLRIEPSSSSILVGGSADLRIAIMDAADLYAFQFDILFDAGVVNSVQPTEGNFLLTAGETFFIPGLVDNTLGVIAATANTLVGPFPGVNGLGYLAVVQVTGASLGLSNIQIANVLLLDSSLNPIAATIENGSMTVVVNAVPECGTASLMLCAGVALAGRYRSRKATT